MCSAASFCHVWTITIIVLLSRIPDKSDAVFLCLWRTTMADDLDIEALLDAPFRKVSELVHWCVDRQPDPTAPYTAINTQLFPFSLGFKRNIKSFFLCDFHPEGCSLIRSFFTVYFSSFCWTRAGCNDKQFEVELLKQGSGTFFREP